MNLDKYIASAQNYTMEFYVQIFIRLNKCLIKLVILFNIYLVDQIGKFCLIFVWLIIKQNKIKKNKKNKKKSQTS